MPATTVPVHYSWDVPKEWRGTPLGDLLEYHALGKPHGRYDRASLLIVACMDHRVALRIPDRFAYVLRVAGANLHLATFQASYVLAMKGVRFVAFVAHTQCGAADIAGRRREIVEGLVALGWDLDAAERHVDVHLAETEVGDPASTALSEAADVERDYAGVRAGAFLYDTADGSLSIVREN